MGIKLIISKIGIPIKKSFGRELCQHLRRCVHVHISRLIIDNLLVYFEVWVVVKLMHNITALAYSKKQGQARWNGPIYMCYVSAALTLTPTS